MHGGKIDICRGREVSAKIISQHCDPNAIHNNDRQKTVEKLVVQNAQRGAKRMRDLWIRWHVFSSNDVIPATVVSICISNYYHGW